MDRFSAALEKGSNSNEDNLLGLGAIDDGAALKNAGGYRKSQYSIGLSIVDPISSDANGLVVDSDTAYTQICANRYIVSAELTASFTNTCYARAYFSVDGTQAIEGGLPRTGTVEVGGERTPGVDRYDRTGREPSSAQLDPPGS